MVTSDEVLRVAELARLRLEDAEVANLTADLSGILAHFEVLRSLDLGGTTAAAPAEETQRLRADSPGADPLTSPPGALAPEWRDGFFALPRLPALDAGDGDAGTP